MPSPRIILSPSHSCILIVGVAVAAVHLFPFTVKFASSIAFGRAMEVDFTSFYFAADAAINHLRSPYSIEAMEWYRTQIGSEVAVWPFLYPPTSIIWFYPLALFPFHVSIALFQVASAASLVLLVTLLYQHIIEKIPVRPWRYILIGSLFAFFPLSLTFSFGQINVIATLMILLAWLSSCEPDSDRRVALYLFVATVLKTYPALFLCLYLIKRRGGVILWFAAFAAFTVVISLAVLPSATWAEWLGNIAPTGSYGTIPFGLDASMMINNQNLNAMLTRLVDQPDEARRFTTVLAAFCGLVALVAAFRNRHTPPSDFYGISYTVLLSAIRLIAPVSWLHHFVFLIPAVCYVAHRVSCLRTHARVAAVAHLTLFAILVLLAYEWPIDDMRELRNPIARSMPLLGPLALFALSATLAIVAPKPKYFER